MPADDIVDQARTWLAHDPDPETRAELATLIEARSPELAERFAGPLDFGTAGLRGILGAGESRMNRAVVRRTSAGLGRYLLAHEPDVKTRGVVVACDGRRLSREMADDTAGVLCALGIPVALGEDLSPTPLCAFAVLDTGAVAGVMVTASHNPPEYNGYKVYARNGAQIIAPADGLIAAEVASAGHADEIPLLGLAEAAERGLLTRFGAALEARYLAALRGLYGKDGDRSLGIVYTPLHGVGAKLFRRAFEDAGFAAVRVVQEQEQPDGEFPTVSFPNPEEPGALDLAYALATAADAPLILANDPDADRLAAAVRTAPGRYTQLTGNEIGALLGNYLLGKDDAPDRLVITTIVSSPLLGVMAREQGVAYDEVLTGFKWIANKAMQRAREENKRFVFGFEEALGYTVGTVVRDKDGIGSAVVFAVLAAELHARGETPLDELQRIARRYGVFFSSQASLKFPGAGGKSAMTALTQRLRESPPVELGGHDIVAFTDCTRGIRRERGAPDRPVDLPVSDVLVFDLEGGHRVIVRPSGTEPKMKVYFDVREPLGPNESLEAGKARAKAHAAALEAEIVARLQR